MAERPRLRRCAIYTRKSSEEGLDQAYNSLAAQRDACLSYIASQKHEGWTAASKTYDDGGFSGGSLQRPALQMLMEDMARGEVDIVVVYKIDRLTRSLADFAKLTETMDRHNVSFVAVTQQFNTSTSMGRLTLNVLLSFAQFEREVAGERIRDKIAASKKRGMWMGGHPPLGYDITDRKLIVNPEEAEAVRHIFRRCCTLRSVQLLRRELTGSGMTSKRRQRKDGSIAGSVPFSRGALYTILRNVLYRGLIHHKGEYFQGEHDAIVDQALFDEVRCLLAQQGPGDGARRKLSYPALLKGLVHDATGERLQPTHCKKGRTKYRYYTSGSLLKRGKAEATGRLRVPAPDLEAVVIGALAAHLRRSDWVLSILSNPAELPIALQEANGLANDLERQSIASTGLIPDIVSRIILDKTAIRLALNGRRLVELLSCSTTDSQFTGKNPCLEIEVTCHLLRCGKQMRIIVGEASERKEPDPRLINEIVRARRWFDALRSGAAATISALAESEGIAPSYVSRKIGLAFLAPDIVEAIVGGAQPPTLTPEHLKKACPLPVSWEDQRALLLA